MDTRAVVPLYQKVVAQLPAGTKPSDFIVSLEVQARKPHRGNAEDGISTPA
jgi:hypothetical protein